MTRGSTIPDAKVSIIRVETNDMIVLKTNGQGRFFAPNLPVGTYRVTVSKEGFETAELKGLILQSQMSARADFKMKVGAVSEHVEVSAEAPMLDASNATVAAQLTTKQIDELPLITIGRKQDITSYLQYLPGVTTASTWGARVNGSNPGNSEVFLDGAPASQGNVRGGVQENGPAVEQVGEFSVVTNSFNAEYGRTGSWFTNVTIRSGTNQLHGQILRLLRQQCPERPLVLSADRHVCPSERRRRHHRRPGGDCRRSTTATTRRSFSSARN